MCLNTLKGTSCLRRSKLTFVPSAQFWYKNVWNLKSDIEFLRYGNFIKDVITDWWKFDFEKRALKIWESVQSIGILAMQRSTFTWKLFLYQILQVTSRLSIEDSKIWESQNQLWDYYFEIFWLCIPKTQNPVFRQLVPFDMLSHILLCYWMDSMIRCFSEVATLLR